MEVGKLPVPLNGDALEMAYREIARCVLHVRADMPEASHVHLSNLEFAVAKLVATVEARDWRALALAAEEEDSLTA